MLKSSLTATATAVVITTATTTTAITATADVIITATIVVGITRRIHGAVFPDIPTRTAGRRYRSVKPSRTPRTSR